MASETEIWPALDYPAWRDTAMTLQLWTQIVGKIRLGADALAQSLLAGAALCERAGARDVADPGRARKSSSSNSISARIACSRAPAAATKPRWT